MQITSELPQPERLHCPQHFQNRITLAGGLNRYGQPNFKIAWAQTEIMRQGGEWEVMGEAHVGYRDVLKGDGNPHWMLMMWVDAGKSAEMPHLPSQSDVSFYAENRCPKTGLQILGEYPYHGSYQTVLSLVAKLVIKDAKGVPQMFIEAFPLSTEIVNMMIPIIKGSMILTTEAKMKFFKDEEAKAEDDRCKVYEDAWKDAKRKETLSSTSWLEDKVRAQERAFNASLVAMMSRNKFFQTQQRLGT
jgi:hypothetical protein